MEELLISARKLSKSYNGFYALDEVDFDLPKGEILGLVGKNGAGKTTLIRVLAGLIKPTGGYYSLFGVNDPSKIEEAHKGVVSMIEAPRFFGSLSAEKNLELRIASFLPKIDKSKIEEALRFVGLDEVIGTNKKASNFSLGMKQRLGIALAMVTEPKLMLLDEPTNGLDPEGIATIRELLVKLNKEKGVTILISSHILGELERFATSYCFMDEGKIVASISAEELKNKNQTTITFKTNETSKAVNILNEAGYVASIKGEMVEVKGFVDSSEPLGVLFKNGVPFIDLKEEKFDLESYYLNLLEKGERR